MSKVAGSMNLARRTVTCGRCKSDSPLTSATCSKCGAEFLRRLHLASLRKPEIFKVRLRAGPVTLPPECVCCGNPGTTRLAVNSRVEVSGGAKGSRVRSGFADKTWEFPFCAGCAAHVAAWPTKSEPASWLAGCGCLLMPCAILFPPMLLVGLGIVGWELWKSLSKRRVAFDAALALLSDRCLHPRELVGHTALADGQDGFGFVSRDYAAAFTAANGELLVASQVPAAARDRAASAIRKSPCQFCGTTFDENDPTCPQCNAPRTGTPRR